MKNKNHENGGIKRVVDMKFSLVFMLAVVLFLIIGGIFMCRFQPGAYQPPTPDDPKEISPYLTHKLGPDFFNQVQLDEPFNLQVEQAGLNDILSRMPWPQPMGEAMFSRPVVIFAEQAVYLMGTLEYKGFSSVLTIRALPLMTADKLNLNIRSVHLGMLPVGAVVSKLAQKAIEDNQASFEGEPQARQMAQAIIQNEPFDPVFAIRDKKVRVCQFALKPGMLTLTCVPLQQSTEQSGSKF